MKTPVNQLSVIGAYPLVLAGYEGIVAMGAAGVVHAAEIRVLGPTAITAAMGISRQSVYRLLRHPTASTP